MLRNELLLAITQKVFFKNQRKQKLHFKSLQHSRLCVLDERVDSSTQAFKNARREFDETIQKRTIRVSNRTIQTMLQPAGCPEQHV
jgi:hypothetical protein